MQVSKKRFITYLIIAFLVGAVVMGGMTTLIQKGLLGYVKLSKSDYDTMSETYERYAKLEELYEAAETSFYQEVDSQAMIDGACKGLIAGLEDPYSAYMTAEEYESWKVSATGEYSGIGVTFMQDDQGNYVIVSVQKDSPAEQAGLKEGDFILAADGKEYDDMELLASAMRGKEGTQVKVTYARDGEEDTVTIKREKISQQSVEYEMLDEDTGYIKISSFIEGTYEDFCQALQTIEKDGAANLVLDLRDNGGGLVDSCIEIADEFLDEGVAVYVEDRNGKRQDFETKDGKTDLKTVVLVNENSASASEILAAALQDHGMTIVGQTTFGKGVIQSTAELEDGSALKLTVMQYFSPKGNAIHEKGVKPDYQVKKDQDSKTDAQLQKALELL